LCLHRQRGTQQKCLEDVATLFAFLCLPGDPTGGRICSDHHSQFWPNNSHSSLDISPPASRRTCVPLDQCWICAIVRIPSRRLRSQYNPSCWGRAVVHMSRLTVVALAIWLQDYYRHPCQCRTVQRVAPWKSLVCFAPDAGSPEGGMIVAWGPTSTIPTQIASRTYRARGRPQPAGTADTLWNIAMHLTRVGP